MADTINITVKTEDTALQSLINKLNEGIVSTAEYRKAIRDLSNEATIGSKAQMDLKAVQDQVSQSTKLVTGRTSEFVKLIREQRQEQRLQTFVYMELVRSLDAFGIKNKELLNTLSGGLQTYSGVSFALSAMGGKMAELATPIGIVATALDGITTLIAGVTQKTKKYEIALKSLRDLQYKYALISNEEQRKGLQKNIDDAEKELADIEKKKELARERLAGRGLAAQLFNLGVEEAKAEESRVKAVAALFDFLKEVSDLKNKEITQDKKNRDEFDKTIKKKNQEAIERNKWHVQKMADDYKEGIDEQKKALEGQAADAQYAYQVGTLDAQEYKIKLLDLAKAFEEAGNPTQAVRMRRMADELKKYGTFAEQAAEKIRQLKRDSNLATSAIDAVQGVSQGLARQLGALAEGIQNIGQAWHEFGQIAIRALEQVIEKLIAAQIEAALLALIMAIATGGKSILIAEGAGIGEGVPEHMAQGGRVTKPTLALIGEAGTEYVIPEKNIKNFFSTENLARNFSTSNQIIQNSYGGSKNAVIQPSVSVHPIINNQGLAMQVIIGNQQRSGRVG